MKTDERGIASSGPSLICWFQYLLCLTVAFNWLITLSIYLIWPHLTILCPAIWNIIWLGRIFSVLEICLMLISFLTNRMRASPLMRCKHWKTDGRNVWTATGSMSQNKYNLLTLHESFLVSLCTFQPIIANVKIGVQICFYKIDILKSRCVIQMYETLSWLSMCIQRFSE